MTPSEWLMAAGVAPLLKTPSKVVVKAGMTTDTSGLAMSVAPGRNGGARVGRLQHGSTDLDNSAGFAQCHNLRVRSADRIPEAPMLYD